MNGQCDTIARCGGMKNHDGPCQFGGEYEATLHARIRELEEGIRRHRELTDSALGGNGWRGADSVLHRLLRRR